jgi:tRNA threonylcarbamoyladenosine biosynthesis protein TsaB
MRILAIDVTGTFGSIALYEGGLIEEIPLYEPDGYGHVLFGYLDRQLKRHGWDVTSVRCFAAANGPGSFTGVRIGLAAVKGLAEATGAHAIGVSNLQALAAFGTMIPRAALMDARRGEVYAATYDAELGELSPQVVMPFPAWLSSLPAGPREFISPDASAFRSALGNKVHIVERRSIASAVARIAADRLAAGDPGDPVVLDANYVRRSDAELLWRDK